MNHSSYASFEASLVDLSRAQIDKAVANGACNILRKAIPAFRASRSLSTRFELWWMPAQGLRPFKKARA